MKRVAPNLGGMAAAEKSTPTARGYARELTPRRAPYRFALNAASRRLRRPAQSVERIASRSRRENADALEPSARARLTTSAYSTSVNRTRRTRLRSSPGGSGGRPRGVTAAAWRVAVLEVQLEATRRELTTTTLAIERQRYADQRETFEAMLRLLPAPARRRRWRCPWRRE